MKYSLCAMCSFTAVTDIEVSSEWWARGKETNNQAVPARGRGFLIGGPSPQPGRARGGSTLEAPQPQQSGTRGLLSTPWPPLS